MKKLLSIILVILLMLGLVSCRANNKKPLEEKDTNKPLIVASNSIIADLIKEVVGNNATVYSIVPIGIDPHDYEPLPEDIQNVSDGDLVFYNGLNLETGGNKWFSSLMEITGKIEEKDYFSVSKTVKPKYLSSNEKEEDPHAWLDIQNAIIYVKNITQVMSEKFNENKVLYKNNADKYIDRLEKLDKKAKEQYLNLPKNKKVLVSSEGAFKYFSAAYGLKAEYIWEINTESQGTPDQMTNIIDIVRDKNVPVLFVETSVDSRTMEQVSIETGVPIYATIFTDSLGKKGDIGDNYYDMMNWNLDEIYKGLSS